ncbi:MAG TPA: hypothetical protein VFP65_01320 [Anaeromyxobacteraceae bacterium]|nr:hypothetical protein [Anaeromyxobacteraceae bacterium]
MRTHGLGGTAALLLLATAPPARAADDTVYPADLLAATTPRRVEVVLTDRGPVPAVIQHGRERLEIVVRRASAGACRGDLLIPEYDLRAPAPGAQPVSLSLVAEGRGAFHIRCPREDVPDDAAPTAGSPAASPAHQGS